MYETYRDRMRLSVSYGFNSLSDLGNEIIIENPSRIPVMISYWELFWVKRRMLHRPVVTLIRSADDGYCNITVAPHSRWTMHFVDEHYFQWPNHQHADARLEIRLHIVGRRRPLSLTVYDPLR